MVVFKQLIRFLRLNLKALESLALRVILEIKLKLFYLLNNKKSKLVIYFDIYRETIGMFAELNWVLYCIKYSKSVNALPIVIISSKTYHGHDDTGSDWLEQYFNMDWRIIPNSSYVIHIRLKSLNQLPFLNSRLGKLSNLWEAHSMFQQYLQPLPYIQEKVNEFIKSNLRSNFIGIHWRGTDKVLEAPSVSVDKIITKALAICEFLAEKPKYFFIASDDQNLILQVKNEFKSIFPTIPVIYRDSLEKSENSIPIHHRKNLSVLQRHKMGEDALIDSLILSQGIALIRTASFLSGWCSVFNPALPVYLVNKPYDKCLWFPDREVLFISDYFERKLFK